MKLAAMYTVFNGLELLEGSIKQIYNHVDFIVIGWQDVSNKGHKSKEVVEFIKRFEKDKKIHVIKFTPDLSLHTKVNERNKFQFMIDYCKKKNATHFFLSATDHYYKAMEFVKCKLACVKHGYDVTSTKMFTYYKSPCNRLEPIEDYEMPFICKLYEHTKVSTVKYPVLVDPSVKVNTCEKFHSFPQEVIMMHHFSMVRKDIKNKFRNAAASVNWSKGKLKRYIKSFNNFKESDKIDYFKGRKIKVVTNPFKIFVEPV